MIMSYPVLTPASWSKGRYESYVLHPDGTLVGTVNPSGLAFELVSNRNEIPSDCILFLSSRNQKCSGKWFICANLLQPYRGMATGSRFLCELILLMGATSNTSTLLKPHIILHYYSLRNDLSPTAVLQAFRDCPRSSSFVSNLFDMNLKSACYSNMHIRYLNQIFGPTISSWRAAIPSLAPVFGKQFYQCREGPDQWSLKLSSHKLTLKDISLTKPNISQWHNHSNFHCHDYQQNEGNLRKVTGTNNVGQFKGGKVLVTYTTKHCAYGKYFWMPLPLSPCNVQDFALISIHQKKDVDDYFFDQSGQTMPMMHPKLFRQWMIDLSSENGVHSYIRLTNLQCNGNYFNEKCVMFVVSIVSERELDVLKHSKENVSVDSNSKQIFALMNHNQQDPRYMGTVVFHGCPFPKKCQLGMNEVSLVMAAYPKSLSRYCTSNQGTFHMVKKRLSSMSSRSMGVVSNSVEHDHYNESSMNTSLVPLTSSLMTALGRLNEQAQDASGQILIGLIKKAFSNHYGWKDITSEHICPYGIMTCPQRIRQNKVIESFCNTGHRDMGDSLDDEQGSIVLQYIKRINNAMINDYIDRIYATFASSIQEPRIPLPTTCAWKLIEHPEPYSYKHMSFFIVSECGISWDLSSHVFDDTTDILGGTFLGGIVEHCTSCSLWMEESSGWVTTMRPGSASNFAWGRGGNKNGLKMATRNRVRI